MFHVNILNFQLTTKYRWDDGSGKLFCSCHVLKSSDPIIADNCHYVVMMLDVKSFYNIPGLMPIREFSCCHLGPSAASGSVEKKMRRQTYQKAARQL